MKQLKVLLLTALLSVSSCLFATNDGEDPVFQGVISSVDRNKKTVAVDGVSFQTDYSTKMYLRGTGEIALSQVFPGMKGRFLLANPAKHSRHGAPLLSSMHLSGNPTDK